MHMHMAKHARHVSVGPHLFNARRGVPTVRPATCEVQRYSLVQSPNPHQTGCQTVRVERVEPGQQQQQNGISLLYAATKKALTRCTRSSLCEKGEIRRTKIRVDPAGTRVHAING